MREHVACLMVRSREHEPSEQERLALIAAVEEASDAVDKELEEFKVMAGIPGEHAERPT